jgi:hypothetical protein
MQNTLVVAALLLAALSLANGLYMIADPIAWYHAVPGVIETGPPNTHFITDIGCAYLTSTVLLIAALLRPQSRGVLTLAAVVWPAMHSLVHIVGHFAEGEFTLPGTELFGIYLPVVLQIALGIHWLDGREPQPAATLQGG